MNTNRTRKEAIKITEMASAIEVCNTMATWLSMYKKGDFQIDKKEMDKIANEYYIGGLQDAIQHLSVFLNKKGEWIACNSTDIDQKETQQ